MAAYDILQVRNKTSSARELLDQVEEIMAMAPPAATVIVNDRVDVARLWPGQRGAPRTDGYAGGCCTTDP